MIYGFCRSPDCYSKPWKADDNVVKCPYCGSTMIHTQNVDWAYQDINDWEPSPEQTRYKEVRK